jgi:glycosyltransferase involved in cell wall biosynthesis
MGRPFVSVLIDTFNHERFIEQAVSSALLQDYPADRREIIVVDDGSTDRTPSVLSQFAPHLRILRKPNGGQASAFNHAIPHCRGEIVAFLDGDDWWMPGKLTAVVDAFSSNPSIGLVGHGITEVLADGTQRSEVVHESHLLRIDSVAGARTFRLRKSFLGTSRMAFRSDLLRRIGPVPESLVFEADEFLFTLGALFSTVYILRDPLTMYRLHGQNLFQISSHSDEALRRKLAVISELSMSLRDRFSKERVPEDIAAIILESVDTEASVLRLSLGQGSPIDTVRTEFRSYRLYHENASLFRRILKAISLAPALFLRPKTYIALKYKLATHPLFRKAREKFLPALQPTHVQRTGQWSSR